VSKKPLPAAQSAGKANAGALVAALIPLVNALVHFLMGEPLPGPADLQQAVTEVLVIAVQMAAAGAFGYAAVYRTRNYELEEPQ
jgi:hypothetical protein